jgi:hypothetical protein
MSAKSRTSMKSWNIMKAYSPGCPLTFPGPEPVHLWLVGVPPDGGEFCNGGAGGVWGG